MIQFTPLTNVFTRNTLIPLRTDDPGNPRGTNAVVIQPTAAAVTYALGGSSATGFTLAAGSSPVLIMLTAPLEITGSVQIQLGNAVEVY